MWVVLAAIAVTGFAAFDAEPDADVPAPPGDAGRVAVVGIAPSALFDFTAAPSQWTDPPALPPAPTTPRSEAEPADPPPTTEPRPSTTTTTSTTTSTAPPTTTTTAPTTTTSTTTTTTLPPAPGPASTTHPASVEAWRPLVEAYFPASEVDRALDVMWCESRGDARATNPSSGAAGLFQHIPRYWVERSVPAGFPGADIYDPEANVGVAAWLVAVDGWKHWYPSLHCWG
jgi:hypothetical protein